jgi:hypothetical protein
MKQIKLAGEVMFEIDSLYVSTEMTLSRRFREFPLDGLLLEACLLHFRVVWDFFYRPKKKPSDVVVRDYVPGWTDIDPPPRLKDIREKGKWLDVMIAHLTTHRVDPNYKAGEITEGDIKLLRAHIKTLFDVFVSAPLAIDQREALVNPLAHKFARYETLNARKVVKSSPENATSE